MERISARRQAAEDTALRITQLLYDPWSGSSEALDGRSVGDAASQVEHNPAQLATGPAIHQLKAIFSALAYAATHVRLSCFDLWWGCRACTRGGPPARPVTDGLRLAALACVAMHARYVMLTRKQSMQDMR